MIRFLILIIFNATLIDGTTQELHGGNRSYVPELSMARTNANNSKLIALLVIEGEPLIIPCLPDLKLRDLITSYQWRRHSGDEDDSLVSQFVILKENTSVFHIKKTSMKDECFLQCVARTRFGQLIHKNFAVYITSNSKNMDQDYEELKKDNSNSIMTFDLRTWQDWLAFMVCLWTSLILCYGFLRFLLDFVTRLRQMHHNSSATVCSIIFGVLKDLHTNLNPFMERGQVQSYQSEFGKLEDRHRKEIKDLKDLLSVFRMKITSLEIQLGFLERTQKRPEAKIGHFSHSVGRSIHLQTQMGDDNNKIYDSPRYPRRVKHEVSGAAIELTGHNSDATIYECLPLITPSTKEEYWKMH